jgi:hypothetical protein
MRQRLSMMNKRPAIMRYLYGYADSLDVYKKTLSKAVMVTIRTETQSVPLAPIGVPATPTPSTSCDAGARGYGAIAMDNIHSQCIIAIKAQQLEEPWRHHVRRCKNVEQRAYIPPAPETGRVHGLAIAEELGRPKSAARCLRAGIVHDIGKSASERAALQAAKLTPMNLPVKTIRKPGMKS